MSREKDIFLEALDSPSPAERTAFVLSKCGADAGLLARVEELLKAHEGAGDFLRGDPEAVPGPKFETLSEGPGTVIGRYKLLEKIGEGGFGMVYMAEQREPVRRKVALKILKLGMDTRQVVRRFEAERQALAIMEHPNIARVLDAGATESEVAVGVPPATTLTAGRPYFVMELVRGVPITRFCDENQITTGERLRLFIPVCEAIQHAHQKGVIHRDIKPGNVLITMHDDRAVPKVIDFGIAKAIGQDLTDKTVFTRFHEFLGTPAYMSPEQAQLSGLDIDTRSDIYSLGVLLYELLTGRTPFDARELLSASYDELRRRIREDEPLKPSTRLNTLAIEDRTTIARHRKSDPQHLRRVLKGDLDWIVMKALEKDRSRRYESAAAFAHDIERYLGDEAVTAVAPSVHYRFRKFARRHRTALATAAALLIVLVAATLVSGWLAVRATLAERTARNLLDTEQHSRQQLERTLGELKEARQREEGLRQRADREAAHARTEAATAEAVTRFLNEDLFATADPENEPDREISLRTVLDRGSRQLGGGLTNQPLVAAAIHRTMGRAYRNLGAHETAEQHLRQAQSLYSTELGDRHPESIRALSDFADALERVGHRSEALPLARRACELARENLGEKHPLAFKCAIRLAWIQYRGRDRDTAFALAEQIHEKAKDVREVEPRDLLSTLTLVAFNRGSSQRKDYEGGETILKDAFQFARDRLGDAHLQTVRMKAILAVYYYDRGLKSAECERLYAEVLETYRRALGENHERTLLTRGNLGLFYDHAKQPRKAQYHYLKVLEVRPQDSRPLEVMPRLFAQAPLDPVLPESNATDAWWMTTNSPAAGWATPTFDDAAWVRAHQPGAPEAWARREFQLAAVPREPLVFTIHGWGECEVFINGVLAAGAARFGTAGGRFQLAVGTPESTKALRAGRNIIAIHGAKLPREEFRVQIHLFPDSPGGRNSPP